ncbi:Mitochondrial intermediate peptidase-like protein [Venustampulla echinocandica]|uniref:Mitochondrial intermediate peptidase n=1 Tax=Venustampulla echinocandica TaxID=2656787 RepID=A0A370THV0_9HELO|nr:Mitochondrial intermediate peptidase-like protein [Venustampulla echinocandica]RDL34773.1 Mitochondrial intermediate peptidase-like protein [Venustampulla echinocandica]
MFKTAVSRPWICSTCIRRQLPARRLRSTSSIAPSLHYDNERNPTSSFKDVSSLIGAANPDAQHDDRTLRQMFDSPGFWKDFSQSSRTHNGRNSGLVQNRYLTSADGFQRFAHTSLRKAQRIVEKVLAAKTREEYHQVVRQLDRLSDLLCRVIDLSDFVRATHPNPEIQMAAARAYNTMYEYMNVLNTTTGLAEQLTIAMKDKDAPWGEQERMVARILERDFAKSGIDLSKNRRDRFVSLSQEISDVGLSYTDSMAPEKHFLPFRSSQLEGVDPLFISNFKRLGMIILPTVGEPAITALRTVKDPEVRKEIFMASRTASRSTVNKLETLLQKRAELAKLVGYDSYGHLALEDKMAGQPQSVLKFLNQLSSQNIDALSLQFEQVQAMKERKTHIDGAVIEPWDKDYYTAKILESMRSKNRTPDFLSSYFSLGTVMQGLSRLFSRLYGIRLVPKETQPGEAWNPDVRRLDVVSDQDGHVAVLYCDLFARPGKSPNPAHFTLRCSRWIGDEEIKEAHSAADPIFASAEEAANDGMAISKEGHPGGVMQLPTIALICDFAQTPGSRRPVLLSLSEVITLFHEMGHAIHSILGRTDFQNLSGTRVVSDFAEFPSVLMEHFAVDQNVLSLFARHYETDEPLPYEMVAEQLAFNKKFEAFDIDNQINLSLLDQELHSSKALDPSFDSTRIFHELQAKYSKLPVDPPGTRWQGFFGHLFTYGGTYYSYLFDRAIARRVWQKVFDSGNNNGSISRSSGERLKTDVLRWGGGRDAWHCLAATLEDERLIDPTPGRAMDLVGTWGIEGKEHTEKPEKR